MLSFGVSYHNFSHLFEDDKFMMVKDLRTKRFRICSSAIGIVVLIL